MTFGHSRSQALSSLEGKEERTWDRFDVRHIRVFLTAFFETQANILVVQTDLLSLVF